MKNFILSAAFVLGALSVNASNSLDADFNTPTELVAEDGCTTTTVEKKEIRADGSSTTITLTVTKCD
jgi:ABC-type phosphate transport system substrate-binding protein